MPISKKDTMKESSRTSEKPTATAAEVPIKLKQITTKSTKSFFHAIIPSKMMPLTTHAPERRSVKIPARPASTNPIPITSTTSANSKQIPITPIKIVKNNITHHHAHAHHVVKRPLSASPTSQQLLQQQQQQPARPRSPSPSFRYSSSSKHERVVTTPNQLTTTNNSSNARSSPGPLVILKSSSGGSANTCANNGDNVGYHKRSFSTRQEFLLFKDLIYTDIHLCTLICTYKC